MALKPCARTGRGSARACRDENTERSFVDRTDRLWARGPELSSRHYGTGTHDVWLGAGLQELRSSSGSGGGFQTLIEGLAPTP